jgi:hypothetical protein
MQGREPRPDLAKLSPAILESSRALQLLRRRLFEDWYIPVHKLSQVELASDLIEGDFQSPDLLGWPLIAVGKVAESHFCAGSGIRALGTSSHGDQTCRSTGRFGSGWVSGLVKSRNRESRRAEITR